MPEVSLSTMKTSVEMPSSTTLKAGLTWPERVSERPLLSSQVKPSATICASVRSSSSRGAAAARAATATGAAATAAGAGAGLAAAAVRSAFRASSSARMASICACCASMTAIIRSRSAVLACCASGGRAGGRARAGRWR